MINKRLIALMGNAKKFIGFHVFFQLINLALNITAIFLLADFLQKIYEKNISNADIIKVSLGIIIVIILRFISNILISKMSYYASGKVKQTLREKIYSKLLNLGISYREKFSTSEVVQISMEGVDQLEVYFGRYLPQFFYSVISPIILFAVLSTISVKASLILILCVPLIPISIILIVKIAKKILKKYFYLIQYFLNNYRFYDFRLIIYNFFRCEPRLLYYAFQKKYLQAQVPNRQLQ